MEKEMDFEYVGGGESPWAQVAYIKRMDDGQYVLSSMPADVACEILRNSEVEEGGVNEYDLSVDGGATAFRSIDFAVLEEE